MAMFDYDLGLLRKYNAEAILSKDAASSALLPAMTGIKIGGWSINVSKGPMVGGKQLEEIEESVRQVRPSKQDQPLGLPEILFALNTLELTHEASGATMKLNAVDALKDWIQADIPPIQVAVADSWAASRTAEIQREAATTLEYDWTFTTPYCGGPFRSADGAQATFAPTTDKINKAMLLSRDPILFYAEFPLYESELDDNGVSALHCKIRVMPHCWFVLMRYWLRVDKVMIRVRETRLFCDFSRPESAAQVLREVTWREGTFDQLRKAGAPGEGPAYADPDKAVQTLQAVDPVASVKYAVEKAEL